MAKETIREFVAGMGFELNEADQRRFYEAIEGATLRARLLGDALELMAKAAVGKVGEVATQFEALYNQAQRLGTTGPSIRAFDYAVRQVHGSVEGANAALESFGEFLKNLPPQAAENLAKQLKIPIEDTKDRAKFLLDIYERLSHMPAYLANQFRETYHLGGWSDFQQILSDPQGAIKAFEEEKKRQNAAGITDEAMRKQSDLMKQWLEFSQKMDDYYTQGELNLSAHTSKMLEELNKYIDEHQKKITEFVNWLTNLGFVSDVGKTQFHFDEAKFAEHFETALKAAESSTSLELKKFEDALRPVVEWFERFGRTLSGFFTTPYLDQNGQPEVLPDSSGGSWWSRRMPRWLGGGGAPPGIRARAVGGEAQGNEKALAQSGYDYLRGQGLSRDAALAVLGNARGENPLGSLRVGDNGTAFGQFQWHPDRVADILRNTGIDVRTAGFADQLKAFRWEAEHGAGGGHIWDRLKNAKSQEERMWLLVHGFERSANQRGDAAIRWGFADRYGRSITDKAPPAVSWDTGPAWAALNANLPVGPSSVDNSSRAVNSTVNNSITVNAPDPHSAASMVGVHLDRSAHDVSRNLQGAFQ